MYTELEKIHINIKKLPTDVIREHIIPYIHEYQPEDLRKDIHNFFTTKDILFEIYYKQYNIIEEAKEWIQNDIVRFMNDDIATMFGYTENHIDKFRRVFFLRDKSDEVIKNHINCLIMNSNIIRCIYNQIGIMTSLEREKMIWFIQNIN